MYELVRHCFFQGKNQLRDKGFLFWCLIYPIIMATFFFITFSGIMNFEAKEIPVAISKDNPYEEIFKEIDFISINYIEDKDINIQLEEGKIDAYIDKDLNLLVKESGINQTIIKEVLDQIVQTIHLDIDYRKLDFSIDYVISKNQKSDLIIIAFYSLIAMVSTYGLFAAIESITIIQINLSNIGQRLNTTPLHKKKFLISSVINAFILNIASNAFLLLFIKYILKLDLFTEYKYSLLLIAAGNLFGVALGMIIGVSNKLTIGVKTLIGIAINLVLSFFSGMMSPDIKILIDEKAPILGKLNPLAIITNNLYKINLLGIKDKAGEETIILLIYSLILFVISYGFLRRQTYDCI